MTRPVFAYSPQVKAAEALLHEMGLHVVQNFRINPITSRESVRGTSDATFVEVEGHGVTVPDDIRRELVLAGFLHVVLSDQKRRHKIERRETIASQIARSGS